LEVVASLDHRDGVVPPVYGSILQFLGKSRPTKYLPIDSYRPLRLVPPPSPPTTISAGRGSAATASARRFRSLDAFYRAGRAKFDGDPSFADRSRRRVVLLQGGDEATLALWRRLVDESRRYFAAAYERLGVKLTDADVAGESSYNPMLHDVVKALREAGVLVESDGAQCVFPAGFTNKDGDPLPMIVQKQDGGFGYAATDLAAIRHRIATLGATRVLYVIGAPQQQHLAMVDRRRCVREGGRAGS
jgi:arginyl-tRNA synthetase